LPIYLPYVLSAQPLQAGLLSSVSIFLPLLLLLVVAMVIAVAWKGRTWLRRNETTAPYDTCVGFVNPLHTGAGREQLQHCLHDKTTSIGSVRYDSTQCLVKDSFVELWPHRHHN